MIHHHASIWGPFFSTLLVTLVATAAGCRFDDSALQAALDQRADVQDAGDSEDVDESDGNLTDVDPDSELDIQPDADTDRDPSTEPDVDGDPEPDPLLDADGGDDPDTSDDADVATDPDVADTDVGDPDAADTDASPDADVDPDVDLDPDVGPLTTFGVPDGVLTFFSAPACPAGWTTPEDSAGRALIAVEGAEDVGLSVGDGSAFDAAHSHGFEVSIRIPGAGLGAFSGCCNDDPGRSGDYTISGSTDPEPLSLPVIAEPLCQSPPPAEEFDDHAFPDLAIVFFDAAACPTGWTPADTLTGRFLVSTPEDGVPLESVGEALYPGEWRGHSHKMSGTLSLPQNRLVAAGGPNDDPSRRGNYEAEFQSSEAGGGPPYLQYLACRAEARLATDPQPEASELPAGTMAWFEDDLCPTGWSEAIEHRGRIAVAADETHPSGSTNSATPLAPGEDRVHSHTFSADVSIPSQSVTVFSGCCLDRPSQSGTFTFSGSGEAASTAIPYVNLTACRVDEE